jgi:hypothetical protein
MENSEGSVSSLLAKTLYSLPGGGGEAGSMEGLRGRETGQDEGPGPFPALPLLICIVFPSAGEKVERVKRD